MLVNADFKQLEVLGAFYLSKDEVGYRELLTGVDIHADNQKLFSLPSRLVAKKFKFRLIYGGSAFSYANDPDFSDVSDDVEFWQDVIHKYYKKYYGLERWHGELVERAMADGFIEIPTGRRFEFKPDWKIVRGQRLPKWPRTKILNYPVQGFGADLMVLARILVKRALRKLNDPRILLVSTVHDSIVIDCPDDLVLPVCNAIFMAWEEIPGTFERYFGSKLDLPCKVEIGVGHNLKELTEIKQKETLNAN